MTLFIECRFEIGQKVRHGNHCKGTVMDIELKNLSGRYIVSYLVEYENRERSWVNEYDLTEDKE